MITSCVSRKLRDRSRLCLGRWSKARTNTANRPFSIRKNGTWYTYGHDLTKNVMEVFNTSGAIATTYDYTPFGAVTTQGTFEQPLQWSSEVYDEELALTYYNYRHYNPMDGRWINRDPIAERGGANLYGFVQNAPLWKLDRLGMINGGMGGALMEPLEVHPHIHLVLVVRKWRNIVKLRIQHVASIELRNQTPILHRQRMGVDLKEE